MKTVAVFGGTFNPIHKGHTEIISALSQKPEISKVVLMPTKIPPHKTVDFLADERHRVNMCNIIADKFNNVEVSDLELKRVGKSYTIDTVSELKRLYPDSKIAITIGADMVVTFSEWKNYQALINEVKIFAFGRNTISDDEFKKGIVFLKSIGADIECINKTIPNISSTEIRTNLQNNKDTSKLLDSEIYEYIISNNIYGA